MLAVLKKHDVPGTFFVVGSRSPATRTSWPHSTTGSRAGRAHLHPPRPRREPPVAASPASCPRPRSPSPGATGRSRTSLLRPPYSSSADALDNQQLQVLRGRAARLCHRASPTWTAGLAAPRRRRDRRAATPAGRRRARCAAARRGGNRAATVAALDRLIPRIEGPGLPVHHGDRCRRRARPAHHPRGPRRPLRRPDPDRHRVAVARRRSTCSSGAAVRRRRPGRGPTAGHDRRRAAARAPAAPADLAAGDRRSPAGQRVVPAYNEKETSRRRCVRWPHPTTPSRSSSSTTAQPTARRDIVEALRIPNVRVIRQPNAGKPAALNTGIRAARHEIIVMIDGDTVFEPRRSPTWCSRSPTRGRRRGGQRQGGQPEGLLARWQHIEYVIGFNLDRRVYDVARLHDHGPGRDRARSGARRCSRSAASVTTRSPRTPT